MIPERLELVAFGPFIEPQVVDLARVGARGLFLIHGPTGSGKSMLLDALTFALYGETSGSDRGASDLVANLADGVEAKVALTFHHGGVRYRVERTPSQRRRKKRGQGTTEQGPTAHLYRLREGAAPTLLTDGASQVTRAVCDLLRCDAVQFRQTVVLPQGQFRRVIEDDDTRARTLAEIFDTGRFTAVQERLKAYAAHLRRQVTAAVAERAVLQQRHEVPDADAMAARVGGAAGVLEAAEGAAAAADGRHTAAIEARSDGLAWNQRFDELVEAIAELERLAGEAPALDRDRARLSADRAARDAEPAVRAWRDAEGAAAERRQALTEARGAAVAAAAAAAAAAKQRAEHDAGRAARDASAALEARLAPLAEDVVRLADARGAAVAAGLSVTAAAEAAAALEAEREGVEALRAAAEAEAERLEPLAAQLPAARAAADGAVAALAALDRLDDARRARAEAAPADADDDLASLWPPLTRALAARLEPGAPCPVCGATEHPAAVHGGGPALADAHRALRAVQATALQAAEARTRAEARVENELRSAGWLAQTVPPRAELVAASAAARERLDVVARTDADLAARRADRGAARARIEELASRLAAARTALGDARAAATRSDALLEGLLARLDPAHHDPAVFRSELDGARTALAAFDTAAEALAAAANRAEQAAALADVRSATAETEAAGAEARRAAALDEAGAALRDAGFRTATGEADPAAQAAALLAAEAGASLARAVKAHDDAVVTRTAQRAALEAATAGRSRPDLEALEAAVGAARTERDGAVTARDAARDAHRALTDDLARWRALDAELGTREARQRAAQHLSDLVNGNAKSLTKLDLTTFVLQRILGDVLRYANVHLARMSGGRYRLCLRDRADELRARGLELDVEDRQAGGARRRVATLSGGEGFQASLALALGLSEAAERTSGAVELGALFIDEGFGSLDSDALDVVVRILRELPTSQRRIVGVITHVDELKRRIEAQVLVTRDGLGSRVDLAG